VDLLTLLDEPSAAPVLANLLQPRESQPIQMAALAVLAASTRDAATAQVIIAAWPGLSPAVRQEAMEVMLARPARALAWLKAVEKGDVHAGDIPASRAAMLREHKDAAIRELATKLLKPGPAAARADVIARYQKELLDLRGDAKAGKLLFAQQCAACHRLDGVGFEVGPNLAQFAQRGGEALLANILDPNAEVNPQFVNYIITTTDGDTLTGLIASETAAGVTLNRGGGAGDTIPRSRIESMRSSGLSLMPTNLDAALPPKQMADLLAYLLER
jgi:putative heme-binding domain-containing protein